MSFHFVLETDQETQSELIGLLGQLRVQVVEEAPIKKEFGGEVSTASTILQIANDVTQLVAGAIAAFAFCKRSKSIKINGFEAKGMSADEIVHLLEHLNNNKVEDDKEE